MSANKEIWILDCLPPGRPVEAQGTSIPFAFRGETLVFASKDDAEKWLADYGGANGRLWHVENIATEAVVEPVVEPATEPELTERMQSVIERRVAEILARSGFTVPDALAANSSDISQ